MPARHEPIVVISPHLDDAVLGCGAMLARHPDSVVITVFAGIPDMADTATGWDSASGFGSGKEAMQRRRAEDQQGLAKLKVTPRWLDYLDAQYGDEPDVTSIANKIAAALDELGLERIFFPMGLFHSDHKLVHDAAVSLMPRYPRFHWYAYEEPMYRQIPGQLNERLEQLGQLGIRARCIGASPEAPIEKQHALVEYRSQLTALSQPGGPGYQDALKPERYWKLRLREAVSHA